MAICLQCCRDYYLSGVSIEECRCAKCDQPLVWLETLQQNSDGGSTDDQGERDADDSPEAGS